MTICKKTSHRATRQTICIALTFCVMACVSPKPCLAQSGKDVAKGLLRALIESQLEKSRRGSSPSTQLSPHRGGATQQMQQLRTITTSLTQETATLGVLLQTDSRRNFDVRRRLPDAIQLQARTAALNQRVTSQQHHASVLDEFRGLNNDWGILSHQLGQCKKLSPQTSACIKRVAALDAQYCAVLGIQAQYDSAELTRESYTLTTYVRDLIDDVQHSPQSNGNAASRQLLRDLGRHSQKVEYFAGLASRGSQFNTVVTEYKTLYANWITVEQKLSGCSGHSIVRSMRRIRDTHQKVHELLRIELSLDKTLVLHLIHEADHEIGELFRSITLEQLMTLPDGAAVPEAADMLLGTIENIDDLVHRDQNQQSIAEAWVYTNDAWNQFAFYLNPPAPHPRTTVLLQNIDESLDALQQALGVVVQYDPRTLVKSASSLENLSEQLATTIKRWQSRSGQHNRTLPGKAEQMVALFHHIEQSIATRRGGDHNLHECDEAIAIWQQIRPALKDCDTPERGQLDHIAASFATEIVRLRTMLDGQ